MATSIKKFPNAAVTATNLKTGLRGFAGCEYVRTSDGKLSSDVGIGRGSNAHWVAVHVDLSR